MGCDMRKYIFIGAGGFIGAMLRYIFRGIDLGDFGYGLPVMTLMINVGGAFLLGLALSVALTVWKGNVDLRIGVTVGLLGALTTFSTLCKELALLLTAGEVLKAVAYLAISVVLGYGAAYCGVLLASKLNKKAGISQQENTSSAQFDEKSGEE